MAEEQRAAWGGSADDTFTRSQPGQAGGSAGIRALADELLGSLREAGTAMLESHKQLAAEQTAEVADAVGRFGRSVDQTQSRVINEYCDRASGWIKDSAEVMRTRRWGELALEAEDFARRRPGLFVLAAVGAGFAVGRLLSLAAERERRLLPVPQPVTAPPVVGHTATSPVEGIE